MLPSLNGLGYVVHIFLIVAYISGEYQVSSENRENMVGPWQPRPELERMNWSKSKRQIIRGNVTSKPIELGMSQKSLNETENNQLEKPPSGGDNAIVNDSKDPKKNVEQHELTKEDGDKGDSGKEKQILDNVPGSNSEEMKESKINEKTETDEKTGSIHPEESMTTVFTISNTDTLFRWEQIPYREKYQWPRENAPCHLFNLEIPKQRGETNNLLLCLFRKDLDLLEQIEMHLVPPAEEQDSSGDHGISDVGLKVYGHVRGYDGSEVFGYLRSRFFYGEIYLYSNQSLSTVYVVEDIQILHDLFHQDVKIFRNLLLVVNQGNKDKSLQYNAVVTKDMSIARYMAQMKARFRKKGFLETPFLMFSTKKSSLISAGETIMRSDNQGGIIFSTPGQNVSISSDGSVTFKSGKNKEYTFWPNVRTIFQEGLAVETVQEHEGAIAISAFQSDFTYRCILPSRSFENSRFRGGGYVCKVCLTADKLFQDYFVRYYDRSISMPFLLATILDDVSWIFRSTDWNADGKRDNVGLYYDSQFSIWTYPEIGRGWNEKMTDEQLENFFQALQGVDFSDCCLGIAFTMHRFQDQVYAKNSVSEPSNLAGICALKSKNQYQNLILISGNRQNGSEEPMTKEQLVYLTTHEIGKAFGAVVEGRGEINCDEFGNDKHFIMWPDILREVSVEEKIFSSCSKKSIRNTLSSCRSSCLEVKNYPFCGNGIVEAGEECDCGDELKCSRQNCCYSRNDEYPCHKTGMPCHLSSGTLLMPSNTLILLWALMTAFPVFLRL